MGFEEAATEIRTFDPREITNEYKTLFDKLEKEYRQLMGNTAFSKVSLPSL